MFRKLKGLLAGAVLAAASLSASADGLQFDSSTVSASVITMSATDKWIIRCGGEYCLVCKVGGGCTVIDKPK
jgi:hypothetical protein